MQKNNFQPQKILFYTSIPRSFQTTLIGNLYEICQIYSVILLSEELNLETKKILQNKELFPKLEKIIPVGQWTGRKMNPFFKNYYLYNLTKKIIREYKPDIVITANDIYPFEMYLMRFAKKISALNLCFQSALQMKSIKEVIIWSILSNAYLQYPQFLPLSLRIFFVRIKKFLGHIIYYWFFPLIVGEKPFFGNSSFIFWKASLSPQVADYQIVFSERDYSYYIKNGFPPERIFILPHPLQRKTREIFKKIHFHNLPSNFRNEKKILTIMWPVETINFRKSDFLLISEEELLKKRLKIVILINQILNNWRIFIKPHPAIKDNKKKFQEIVDKIKSVSSEIEIIDPEEAAEKYIEISDIIVGFPPTSTTIFISFLKYPNKPILSLNLTKELLGDYYEDFEGVEYIDNEEKLIKILELIRNNKYQKRKSEYCYESENKEKSSEAKKFSTSIEVIEYLFQCHQQKKSL